MAIISRELGLLFVLTPHTGSSAVGKVMREQLGAEWIPQHHVENRRGKTVVRKKHCTVGELVRHGVIERGEVNELLVFTTVRNPFDRLVTAYHKRRDDWLGLADDPDSWVHRQGVATAADMRYAADHGFDEWLRRRYSGSTMRRLAVASGAVSMYRRFTRGADTVMKFERLQDDFAEVLASVGHDPVEIPTFNPTSTRPTDYRACYDDESRRLVERAARWDLRMFGYEF